MPWLSFGAAVLGGAIVVALAAGYFALRRDPAPGTMPPAGSAAFEPAAWAMLGSQDVHSLAFDPDDPDHVLFGHHGGISESIDGGRTWRPMPVRQDAMSMAASDDDSIVIAGHEVFSRSDDGGRTWRPIEADLPSLDIHGFTRDPADPARMWAYLATGGLWESADGGQRWTRVREGNVAYPLAVSGEGPTKLIGIDESGLVSSEDGGRSWAPLGAPPTYPTTSLAATVDGAVLYAGSPRGVWRSDDGGRTWAATAYVGSAFAIATVGDGQTVAVVSKETRFFRSSDAGATWPRP